MLTIQNNLEGHLKKQAIDILMGETFQHIHQAMHEKYEFLGRENAKLRGVTAYHFLYAGEIYPKQTQNGSSIKGIRINAPSLHYSLVGELETANKMLDKAGYPYIYNFFVAVMSQAASGIALNTLLPEILIGALKSNFDTLDYYALDNGGSYPAQSIVATEKGIQEIKTHFAETITNLRKILMDKLLLQR